MRSLRTRGSGDDGAALLFVVLILVTLIGFAAIALDTAALVQERRELQNGADAAAMAVAQRCAEAATCNVFGLKNTADGYANQNAGDGAAFVDDLCGTTPAPSLPACTDPPSGLPDGANYVQVTTRTGTSGAPSKVPFNFARVFPGTDGQGVSRTASVTWGSPKSMSTAPFVMSQCDWSTRSNNGTFFAPPPPYPPYPARSTYMETIFFHGDGTGNGDGDAEDCDRRNPSGQYVPGGFSFLATDSRSPCPRTITIDDWAPSGTGRSPSKRACEDYFRGLKNTVVAVPVFDDAQGNGNNASYHVIGFAAFYLVSYWFEGSMAEPADEFFGQFDFHPYGCDGHESCIRGYFLNNQIVSEGTVGGPPMGLIAIQYVQ